MRAGLMLPKPYYDSGGITIYHADCREILPLLEPGSVGLVLTDPPYGVNYNTANASRSRGYRPYRSDLNARDFPLVHGDDEGFDPTPLLALAPRGVIWGANNFAHLLPPQAKWLVWDKKTDRAADSDMGDCELAYTWGTGKKAIRLFRHMWAGFQRDSEVGNKHLHPTQKPVALMHWCIKQSESTGLVLDPYMGSGPIAEACHQLRRPYIGIEISEAYCEVAVGRLSQQVLPLEFAS